MIPFFLSGGKVFKPANKKSLKGIMATRSHVDIFGHIDSLELTLKNYAQLNWVNFLMEKQWCRRLRRVLP